MGDRARLGVISSRSARVHLKLTMQAFGYPRRVRLAIDGTEIATALVTTERAAYDLPSFAVASGSHFIELASADGADTAGPDPRRLSVALFDIALSTGS
jgi:hypothetical protein